MKWILAILFLVALQHQKARTQQSCHELVELSNYYFDSCTLSSYPVLNMSVNCTAGTIHVNGRSTAILPQEDLQDKYIVEAIIEYNVTNKSTGEIINREFFRDSLKFLVKYELPSFSVDKSLLYSFGACVVFQSHPCWIRNDPMIYCNNEEYASAFDSEAGTIDPLLTSATTMLTNEVTLLASTSNNSIKLTSSTRQPFSSSIQPLSSSIVRLSLSSSVRPSSSIIYPSPSSSVRPSSSIVHPSPSSSVRPSSSIVHPSSSTSVQSSSIVHPSPLSSVQPSSSIVHPSSSTSVQSSSIVHPSPLSSVQPSSSIVHPSSSTSVQSSSIVHPSPLSSVQPSSSIVQPSSSSSVHPSKVHPSVPPSIKRSSTVSSLIISRNSTILSIALSSSTNTPTRDYIATIGADQSPHTDSKSNGSLLGNIVTITVFLLVCICMTMLLIFLIKMVSCYYKLRRRQQQSRTDAGPKQGQIQQGKSGDENKQTTDFSVKEYCV